MRPHLLEQTFEIICAPADIPTGIPIIPVPHKLLQSDPVAWLKLELGKPLQNLQPPVPLVQSALFITGEKRFFDRLGVPFKVFKKSCAANIPDAFLLVSHKIKPL